MLDSTLFWNLVWQLCCIDDLKNIHWNILLWLIIWYFFEFNYSIIKITYAIEWSGFNKIGIDVNWLKFYSNCKNYVFGRFIKFFTWKPIFFKVSFYLMRPSFNFKLYSEALIQIIYKHVKWKLEDLLLLYLHLSCLDCIISKNWSSHILF